MVKHINEERNYEKNKAKIKNYETSESGPEQGKSESDYPEPGDSNRKSVDGKIKRTSGKKRRKKSERKVETNIHRDSKHTRIQHKDQWLFTDLQNI